MSLTLSVWDMAAVWYVNYSHCLNHNLHMRNWLETIWEKTCFIKRFCCRVQIKTPKSGSFPFSFLWLPGRVRANRMVWVLERERKKERNSHLPEQAATVHLQEPPLTHTGSAFPPRRPLWANQSTTPSVQSAPNVSYPSDSPAPSRLHCTGWHCSLPTHWEGRLLLGDGGRRGSDRFRARWVTLSSASPWQ